MNYSILQLWIPLSTTPLPWLVITIAAYLVACAIQRACRSSAFASPVLIAIAISVIVVLATGTSYATYFAGTQFINFLLGPATIALAIPLARNARLVRENLHSVGLALVAGSVTSIMSGISIVSLFGGSRPVALSMAPKAITTPIAVALSGKIGGVPALTATLAILGGILAAAVGRHMLLALKVKDWRAHGLAAGIAGSGIAAAQAATLGELSATFAALGIGLNGLLTTVLVSLLVRFWH